MNTLYDTILVIGLMLMLGIVYAFPVMFLWNWLMPELFGLKAIDPWQALGLSMLCSFLFKSNSRSSKS